MPRECREVDHPREAIRKRAPEFANREAPRTLNASLAGLYLLRLKILGIEMQIVELVAHAIKVALVLRMLVDGVRVKLGGSRFQDRRCGCPSTRRDLFREG